MQGLLDEEQGSQMSSIFPGNDLEEATLHDAFQ